MLSVWLTWLTDIDTVLKIACISTVKDSDLLKRHESKQPLHIYDLYIH